MNESSELRVVRESVSHHGFLVGGAGHGHTTTGAFSLLGELHIHLPMILRDQAVVEVIILDLQEDGLPVDEVPGLQEVNHFGGDEHAVAVDWLHCNEAEDRKQKTHCQSDGTSGLGCGWWWWWWCVY